MKNPNPFRYFKTSPEIIRLAVMMYVRFPLSLRNVEDLLHERGIDICHETVRYWWHRFGPMFAHQIRNRRTHSGVLSDECELVSVWHECGDIMQHKVDATRREQRCVEV